MRHAALGLALLALAFVPAAHAQAPLIFTFDGAPGPGAVFVPNPGCNATLQPSGGFDMRGGFLRTVCVETADGLSVERIQPTALAELYVRAVAFEGTAAITVRACGPDRCSGDPIASVSFRTNDWVPVVLEDRDGTPSIQTLLITATNTAFVDVDDVGISTTIDQPQTLITSAPPPATSSTSAAFTYSGNQPLLTFNCTFDGLPLAGCAQSALTGLGLGTHTFTVAAVDRWNRQEPTPATHLWTITAPPAPDGDRDGIPDARDNCVVDANSGQADADGDRFGDACDLLPPGNVPAVAGVNTVVELLSGEVFVRLPTRGLPSLSGLFQESGFVPLKGIASLPVGSTVDARKGRLGLTSAANTRPVGDSRRRLQTATFAAGIFRIRQAAARVASNRRVPTDAVLVSGADAARVCASSRRRRAARRTVRTLSVTAKGLFRTVGGASVTTARNATWITTDRCDGTLTQVGRGRVEVRRRGRKRSVVVRAGRAYLVRERLFRVRKGRGGPSN